MIKLTQAPAAPRSGSVYHTSTGLRVFFVIITRRSALRTAAAAVLSGLVCPPAQASTSKTSAQLPSVPEELSFSDLVRRLKVEASGYSGPDSEKIKELVKTVDSSSYPTGPDKQLLAFTLRYLQDTLLKPEQAHSVQELEIIVSELPMHDPFLAPSSFSAKVSGNDSLLEHLVQKVNAYTDKACEEAENVAKTLIAKYTPAVIDRSITVATLLEMYAEHAERYLDAIKSVSGIGVTLSPTPWGDLIGLLKSAEEAKRFPQELHDDLLSAWEMVGTNREGLPLAVYLCKVADPESRPMNNLEAFLSDAEYDQKLRSKVKELLNAISDPVAYAGALQYLEILFRHNTVDDLETPDSQGISLVDNLIYLAQTPIPPSWKISRDNFYQEFFERLTSIEPLIQGDAGTCSTMPIIAASFAYQPSETIRLIRELADTGEVTLANGKVLKTPAELRDASYERDFFDTLFQSVLMEHGNGDAQYDMKTDTSKSEGEEEGVAGLTLSQIEQMATDVLGLQFEWGNCFSADRRKTFLAENKFPVAFAVIKWGSDRTPHLVLHLKEEGNSHLFRNSHGFEQPNGTRLFNPPRTIVDAEAGIFRMLNSDLDDTMPALFYSKTDLDGTAMTASNYFFRSVDRTTWYKRLFPNPWMKIAIAQEVQPRGENEKPTLLERLLRGH